VGAPIYDAASARSSTAHGSNGWPSSSSHFAPLWCSVAMGSKAPFWAYAD